MPSRSLSGPAFGRRAASISQCQNPGTYHATARHRIGVVHLQNRSLGHLHPTCWTWRCALRLALQAGTAYFASPLRLQFICPCAAMSQGPLLQASRSSWCRAKDIACPVRATFSAWKQYPEAVRRQECQAQQWHDQRLRRSCFLVLFKATQLSRSAREATLAHETAAHALVQHCFGCWRGITANMRREHNAHAFLIKQADRLSLSRVLCGWWVVCSKMQASRIIASRAGSQKDRSLVGSSFQSWRTLVSQKLEACCTATDMYGRKQGQICRRVLFKWCEIRAQVAVGRAAWHACLRNIGREEKRRLLSAIMTAWMHTQERSVEQRRQIMVFVHKSRRCRAQAAFVTWRRNAEARMVTEQQHVDATNAWLLRTLTRAFGAWQHAALAAKRRQRHAAACSGRLSSRALAAAFYAWIHRAAAQQHQQRLCKGTHPPAAAARGMAH